MNVRTFFLSTVLCMGILISHAQNYTKSGNFITINVQNRTADGPQLVRLQVMNDKIIRVEATHDTVFPQKQSLIIVPQTSFNNFEVFEIFSS